MALLDVFREAHAQSVGMNRLTESINQDKEEPFSPEEIQAALTKMQDDNQVMVSEGIIFLIWGGLCLNFGASAKEILIPSHPYPYLGLGLYFLNNSV